MQGVERQQLDVFHILAGSGVSEACGRIRRDAERLLAEFDSAGRSRGGIRGT